MDSRGNSNNLPLFWEILALDDQQTYMKISNALGAPTLKNKRNTKIDTFSDALEAIDIFQNHSEVDKWKRFLVCGVVKFDGGIAVNINQLRKLVRKCKTSINTSLKGMGYTIISGKSSECPELLRAIPCLRGNSAELRQWTIRYLEKDDQSQGSMNSENDSFITPPEMVFDNGDDDSLSQAFEITLHNPITNHASNNQNTVVQQAPPPKEEQINVFDDTFSFEDFGFEHFSQWEDEKFNDPEIMDHIEDNHIY